MLRPDYFLFKNIFLALAASLLVYATQVLCGVTISYPVILSLGLFAFVAYQLASWYPTVAGYGISFKQTPLRAQRILTLACAIIALLILPLGLLKLLGLPALLTILYYLHWPSGWLTGGIRTIFLVKNLVVSFVWTYLTYNLPLYPLTPDAIAWVARFVLVLILTLGLDLRDREADLQRNVKTLPGHLGFTRAKQLTLIFAALSIIVFFFQSFPGKMSTIISLMMAIFAIFYLKPKSGYWKYFFALDGILVLYALFLAV